ncbi:MULTISPECIES: EAL domain-containing protein [unclassified Clostridioides]|uniref:EAL domain-containing protein n=1 Tax=unclassified Clostridioides TaxID=2635829 RepID=UPI001D101873|nr:EAL domain-containing protein [Clostridioides sp. ES-S-0171-01]MCC0687872.1 EAL domain-containing protein [Clostridioides sp. ES-S-0056-01]MCC0714646.1 EAL domain-containing protein [Clostridioides sp. ES-S-0077-01]UDN53362.1 EAL domain-containing protein [Clostridioides sp. ES-S-0054-01]
MKNKPIIIICSILAIGIVGMTMLTYVNFVRGSLWEKSVYDILESTTAEQKSFKLYVEKDVENLTSILKGVSFEDEEVKISILQKLELEGINYVYVNLKEKTFINNSDKEQLPDEEVEKLKAFQSDKGIIKPYFNRNTGVKMVAVYVKSGDELIIKETRADYIAEQFSLSFYNDLGFSYIVDDTGNVLIRANHKNANRTMQNLFDIIDLEGNDKKTVKSFEDALLNHQKGYALFNYHDDANVFCYVPVGDIDGWYIVSIIQNDVIMTQANHIIIFTIILSLIIIGAIGCIVFIYRHDNRKHKNEIMYLAYYDTLTNLYNYQKFKEEGNKKIKDNSKNWAVIYIDIAGFKIINDLNGYKYGDKILKSLAGILSDSIPYQGITCHMTADKFLLMCDYKEKQDLVDLCAKIYQKFYLALKSDGIEKERVMKFGICCLEDMIEIKNIDRLIDGSHLALTEVNMNRKDYYCFYNYTMRERIMEEAAIESKMEKALENKEFTLYLQPKYNVQGSHILGAEALVRWIDKSGNMVMPGDFIPIFEKNGFILKLDEYVFESVCEHLAGRIKKQLPVVSVSINISRLHFYQADFLERYLNIKNKYRIPDYLLELEVTENILLEDMKKVQEAIVELQSNGFICSIDDFGSGYSSLNALKNLSFDVIKLDKLFLDNTNNTERSEEIIKSIINMAKQINIKTVAEGIETNEQLEFLKKTDCDMIQGYIFSRPLPIHEFEKLLN